MNDKDLLEKLNNLKITPNSEWKKTNREILLSQIYQQDTANLNTEDAGNNFIGWFLYAFSRGSSAFFAKPVATVLAILVVVFGGGIASIKAAKNAKPGDSLYVAKIINEKTHQALTFDERKKTRLNIEFAGNRTREIAKVLQEEEGDIQERKETVKKLKESFKKEIKAAKANLKTITEAENTEELAKDESEVFSAGIGKVDQGMQISEPEEQDKNDDKEIEKEDSNKKIDEQSEESGTSNDAVIMLDQAENLLENLLEEQQQEEEKDDYNIVLEKLDEANTIIKGEIKGASEEILDNNEKEEYNDVSNIASSTQN